MAQRLERRSLTGGLSLIYRPEIWLTCDQFVGKVSAVGQPTMANSAFRSFGVGKCVVIHVINAICVILLDLF